MAYGVLQAELEGHRDVAASAPFVVDPVGELADAPRGDGPADAPDLDAVRRVVRGNDGREAAAGSTA